MGVGQRASGALAYMAFKRRSLDGAEGGAAHICAGACARLCACLMRASLSILLAVALVAGVLYLRLSQGPIHLPGVARYASAEINEGLTGAEVEIADLILTLGEGRAPAGLQFVGVTVRSKDGGPLIDVPRAAATFRIRDLVAGRVQPTQLTLIGPRTRITRDGEGQMFLGVGDGRGVMLGASGGGAGDSDAWALLDGFAGGEMPVTELARLTRVRVIDADLVYDDRMTGRYWHAPSVQMHAERATGGVRAQAEVRLAGGMAAAPSLRVAVERRAGLDHTDLRLMFDDLSPALLSRQVPELATELESAGGTFEGQLSASLAGIRLTRLDGDLIVRNGRLPMDSAMSFDRVRIGFSYDAMTDRIVAETLDLTAPGVEVALRGLVDLGWQRGTLERAAAQIDIEHIGIDLPEMFPRALRFDRGQLLARWQDGAVEIADTYLTGNGVHFLLNGKVVPGPHGAVTDLRLQAQRFSIRDGLAHWPVDLARNARTWIDENISAAQLDDLVAQLRLGDGEPQLSLDFAYSGLLSTYLGDLPPIRDARGRGSLTLHRLALRADEAHVTTARGERVEIGGSEMELSDLNGAVTPADIRLTGTGPVRAILELIDHEPLGLVRKVGLDPSRISGQAAARARLDFPLIQALKIEEVGVDARADLTGVAMPLRVSDRDIDVRADRMRLTADDRAMTLSGRAETEGMALDVAWEERYGGSPGGRSLRLAGVLDDRVRAQHGLGDLPIEGPVPVRLSLDQRGSDAPRYELDADLRRAGLELSALDWTKGPGSDGRLTARGRAALPLSVEAFELTAPGLEAAGEVQFDASGLREARIDRFRLSERADLGATIKPGADGTLGIALKGRFLDVSGHLEAEGGEGGPPLSISFDLEELQLSETFRVAAARGTLSRQKDGGSSITLSGRLNGAAPLEISLDQSAGAPGTLRLTSGDAGALLWAADVYRGASGGTLSVDGEIAPAGQTITGRVLMQEITVRSQDTFRTLLDEGGLAEARETAESGGVTFRKVRIPFSYADDKITLSDAVALSSLLSITADGDVDQAAGTVDLVGVITPAYGVTGALDEIPVLGQLLSGREGEGVFGMTFSLDGSVEDPEISVNPLSLLTPGFLRNIFRGARRTPQSALDFHERIRRKD